MTQLKISTSDPDDLPSSAPPYKGLPLSIPAAPFVDEQPSYANEFIMSPASERSSSELVTSLLDTSRILEKVSVAIPVAGGILQGIFGLTTLVLERVDVRSFDQ